jgi:hypothetical protein
MTVSEVAADERRRTAGGTRRRSDETKAALDTLVLRGSALLIALRPGGPWQIRLGLLLLAGVALLNSRLLRSPWLWLGLALVASARLVVDWPLPDNHLYLLAYWCLALAIALRSPDPAASASLSARLLIGVAFAFAVLWKAFLSPDFRDGRFFRVTLLTDPRLSHATLVLGGLTSAELQENRRALEPWPAGAEPVHPPQLFEPAAFKRLVVGLTWATIALEGVIALTFLAPLKRPWSAARHLSLLGFCVVAYALAPVASFAWLLLVMGLATLDRDQVWLRRAYIGISAVVLLWAELPWSRLARAVVGG